MTWVKICGTTNLEDALVAVEAGADAVGFVFYEKSPRYVTVETAREICEKLPERVEKVGVFVGGSVEGISKMMRQCRMTIAQIYPREPLALTDEFFEDFPFRVIVALSAEDVCNDKVWGLYASDEIRDRFVAVLFDSGNAERPGGTGKTFDWQGTGDLRHLTNSINWKLIVAGGLSPANVAEAMWRMKPWGVDVVSGVEASPGKKDPEKVRAFVRAVREADRKAS